MDRASLPFLRCHTSNEKRDIPEKCRTLEVRK